MPELPHTLLLLGMLFGLCQGCTSTAPVFEASGHLLLANDRTDTPEAPGDLIVVVGESTMSAVRKLRVTPLRLHGNRSPLAAEAEGAYGELEEPGTLTFPGLQAGRYSVILEAKAANGVTTKDSQIVGVRSGAVNLLEVGERDSLVRVHGRITLNGRALSGASVTSVLLPEHTGTVGGGIASAKTDQGGRFELSLPAGPVALRVHAAETNADDFTMRREIPEGQDYALELAMPGNGVFGVVLNTLGQPLAGVDVSLAPDRSGRDAFRLSRFGRSRTDKLGRFAFRCLTPGSYSIYCGGPGWSGALGENELGRAIAAVEVGGLEGRLAGLELRLSQPCQVQGKLTCPDGRAAVGARVYVRGRASCEAWTFTGKSDSTGHFNIAGLAPGELQIQAVLAGMDGGFVSERIAFVAGDGVEPKWLGLTLVPAHKVELRFEDKDGLPQAFRVLAFAADGSMLPYEGQQTLLRNEQTVGYLAAGHYLLRAWSESGEMAEMEVEVAD